MISERHKKIVIAFFIDFIVSNDDLMGGTEHQLIELIEKLDKKKYLPILICLKSNKNNIKILRDLEIVSKNLNVQSILSISGFRNTILTASLLKKYKVDIVHSFFFDSIFFSYFTAKLAKVKFFITSRRDMGFWYTNQLLFILKLFNKYTTKILVNSHAIKMNTILHEKINKNRIDIIYNGIDLIKIDKYKAINLGTFFQSSINNDLFIGIVSNFNRPVKRVELFIKAAALVKKSKNEVKFLIVGGGKLEKDLRKLTQDLAVEDQVIFCGPQNEVIPYIKNFFIGVLTSDSEGFSNVLLEYMACGIPAVATRVGGNVELIQDGLTGLLVPPGNPDKLAEGILKLLDNDLLRETIIKNARNEVLKRYDWRVKIKEIETYYENLVNC